MLNNNVSFGSATRMYFFTNEGKRIISDENIRNCERYVVRNLNGAKNLKNRNMDLVRNFVYDRNQKVGDVDFYNYAKVHSGYGLNNGKVTLITGRRDNEILDNSAKRIGQAKHEALIRTGSTKSFEVSEAVKAYNKTVEALDTNRGIYKDGERQAFKVVFEPTYKRNGEFKGFEYKNSGYFNESELTNK